MNLEHAQRVVDHIEAERRKAEEQLPKISPHGEVEEGVCYRTDADEVVRRIEDADTPAELKTSWGGSVSLYESYHPTDRKAISYAYRRRERQLNKPGRELDAPRSIKTQEKEKRPMSRMTLASIERGRRKKPYCVLVYGPAGVGKTTFAAGAPDPIFLEEARGSDELDVARFPKPEKWEEVDEALDLLENEEKQAQTLVIDTLDFLEKLCWDFVCRSVNPRKPHIKDFGFGDGYLMALTEFMKLTRRLELLQDRRGVNIILLAQEQVQKFKNPTADDYDRYSLNLDKRLAAYVRTWPSAVLFANYRVYTNKGDDKRIRGVSDGSRVLYCNPNAAWHAKNRYSLPDEIPLTWDDFVSHASGEAAVTSEELIASIRSVVAGSDKKLLDGVELAISKAGGDIRKLEQIKDKAIGRMKGQSAA